MVCRFHANHLDVDALFRDPQRSAQRESSDTVDVIGHPEASLDQLFSQRICVPVIQIGAAVVAQLDAVSNRHPGNFPVTVTAST